MTLNLLITRPQQQAEQTAALLKTRGFTPIIEPMLKVELLETPLPQENFDAIILTSSNAIPILTTKWPASTMRKIPVLATGESTRDQARFAGFHNCDCVQGSALELSEQVPSWMQKHHLSQSAKLLYPCAETRAHDLTIILAAQKIECHPWPTYRTIAATEFTKKSRLKLEIGKIDGVLVYSKRSAQTFLNLIQNLRLRNNTLTIYALSREICSVFDEYPSFLCQFPKETSQKALFSLLQNQQT